MLILKLLVTLILSYTFIKIVMRYAKNMKLHYSHISHHTNQERLVPVGGGIGIFFAIISSFLLFEIDILINYWYIFFSILLIFIIGVIDDIKDVHPYIKFVVIIFAVIFLIFHDVYITSLGDWFGVDIDMPIYIAIPFTMFAVAGFTNAMNLIDGIDGLAGVISIIILTLFVLIGLKYNDTLIVAISSISIVSSISFLILNWNPAKIFMGDSGSLSLGFIISLLAILSIEYIHPITILYLAALPILDTLIVMVRRIRRGKSPFDPDKTHIHHILVKFFTTEKNKKNNEKVITTVFFLAILQIVFSGIGYMLIDIISNDTNGFVPFVAFFGFCLMFIIFYMIFTGIKKDKNY
ncbi:MAG: MraY family glycosyltransferase [Campylobacterota bacterium]|nr:MraY family glycosyltransferase [Campylobacterota bacterium]